MCLSAYAELCFLLTEDRESVPSAELQDPEWFECPSADESADTDSCYDEEDVAMRGPAPSQPSSHNDPVSEE